MGRRCQPCAQRPVGSQHAVSHKKHRCKEDLELPKEGGRGGEPLGGSSHGSNRSPWLPPLWYQQLPRAMDHILSLLAVQEVWGMDQGEAQLCLLDRSPSPCRGLWSCPSGGDVHCSLA